MSLVPRVGEAKLKEFINHINSSHDTIKFTSEHSRDSISFLDVQVILSEGESCRQTYFASLLIHISTCTRSLVIHGTLKKRSPIARHLGIAGFVLKIAFSKIR